MNRGDPRGWIETLAELDRSSCSPGESQAAELIARALSDRGADVSIERPRVHGTYWWPQGIASAGGVMAGAAGRAGRRRTALICGALATALAINDLEAGDRWLRRLLRKQRTSNVLAWAGDLRAASTLIVVAHHDAAHTGLFFNPRISELLARRAGAASGKAPPVQLPLVAGPAAAGLSGLPGLRRLAAPGALACLGIIASMLNIARSRSVAGANDNLTGVATLIGLAERLQAEPAPGLRVLLLSTGAEEALMEGMHAFAVRHLALMDPERTHVLCVDSVGSPNLVLADGQGMLRVRPHDPFLVQVIAECADEAGVPLLRGFEMRFGTDGYVALRRGFRTALLMSTNEYGMSSNYHWPTDTPDRVDYGTLDAAIDVCERLVRRLAGTP